MEWFLSAWVQCQPAFLLPYLDYEYYKNRGLDFRGPFLLGENWGDGRISNGLKGKEERRQTHKTDPWTTQRSGVPFPHSHISMYKLLTPPKLNYSRPSGSREGLVSGPPRIPTSMDAPVPGIKWHQTVHTVSRLQLWVPNCRSKTLFLIHGLLSLRIWN